MSDQKLTYKSSGVNYDLLDKLKRMGQIAGQETFKNLLNSGFTEDASMQGESALVISSNDYPLSFTFVEEGLGTKNLVADAFGSENKSYYDAIAQDTVGAIVNDLITVGTKPLTIMAYWAVGSEEWLKNDKRLEDLVNGWKHACNLSGIAWTGGETPMLSGIIEPSTIDLAGAAFGVIAKDHVVNGSKLTEGDAIVLFESSGIHANGVSLARKLAEQLPEGYETKLPSGRMYGEALLDPTVIYAKLVQELFAQNINIHYMANITGHGWRKLMRNRKEFTYRMTTVPPIPEVLSFIAEKAQMDDKEAYATFNMGAGFAIYVPQEDVQKVLDTSQQQGINAYNAGIVEAGKKQVIIEPLQVTYSSESLQVRV